MEYGKITTDGQIVDMPNPYRVVISNPTEDQKAKLAEWFGWIPKETTNPPEYDPETQYVTYTWKAIDGRIIQVWEIHDLPPVEEEPTNEEEEPVIEEPQE